MKSHFLRAVAKTKSAIEYINTYYDDTDKKIYTFSSIPVTPGLIVVCVHIDFGTHSITSVTIDGNTATTVASAVNASIHTAGIYSHRVSSSGDISVVVTTSVPVAVSRCGIAVYRVYDNASDTAISGTATGTSQSSLSVTLNSLSNGSVIIAANTHGSGGVTSTFTNVTERYDSNREAGGSRFSGGNSSDNSGTVTVTDTYSSSTGGQALAVAAWA